MAAHLPSTPPVLSLVCRCGPVSADAFGRWMLNGYYTDAENRDLEMRTCRKCHCTLSVISLIKRGDVT